MTKAKATLEDTGERMVPEFHKGGDVWGLVYAEHVTRYLCAKNIVAGKKVLDIASGSGYGTRILSEVAEKAYGVDVDETAVAYAQKHFAASNIEYKVGNGTQIPLGDDSVDVVVTFETIEHIEDYAQFLHEIKRVLKPDGLAIISTPNDLEFAEGNHFHIHEFEYQELTRAIKKYFKNISPYFQATWKYVMLGSEKLLSQEGSLVVPTTNMAPLQPAQCLYFYLLCSNRDIHEGLQPLAALGSQYSDRKILHAESVLQSKVSQLELERQRALQQIEDLNQTIQTIRRSRTYKLARKFARARHMLHKASGG